MDGAFKGISDLQAEVFGLRDHRTSRGRVDVQVLSDQNSIRFPAGSNTKKPGEPHRFSIVEASIPFATIRSRRSSTKCAQQGASPP